MISYREKGKTPTGRLKVGFPLCLGNKNCFQDPGLSFLYRYDALRSREDLEKGDVFEISKDTLKRKRLITKDPIGVNAGSKMQTSGFTF